MGEEGLHADLGTSEDHLRADVARHVPQLRSASPVCRRWRGDVFGEPTWERGTTPSVFVEVAGGVFVVEMSFMGGVLY